MNRKPLAGDWKRWTIFSSLLRYLFRDPGLLQSKITERPKENFVKVCSCVLIMLVLGSADISSGTFVAGGITERTEEAPDMPQEKRSEDEHDEKH
jgi:hypothetical protein